MPKCLWCQNDFENPPTAFVYDDVTGEKISTKRFCNGAHRQAYKRVTRAMGTAQLVEKLGPYVNEAGRFIYDELVKNVAWRVNESV